MSVKRPLKIDGIYTITKCPAGHQADFLGYKCRVVMQLSDDHLPAQLLAAEVIAVSGPKSGCRAILHGIGLRISEGSPEGSCSCKAYSFPHRRGSGRCHSKSDGPFCGECGSPCEVSIRKQEPEEKTPGNYLTKWRYKSKCCGGIPYEDANLQIQYSEDDDG